MSTRLLCIAMLSVCPGFSQTATPPTISGYQALVNEAKSKIKEVTVADLKQALTTPGKPVLIDVREDNEWQAGRAEGALHIGRGVLERRIETTVPNKDTPIVLYCAGGSRSALAAESLQKMGYTNVSSLAGGFTSYKAAGLPAAK
jgi:rhodanese-related sulfurtransferase